MHAAAALLTALLLFTAPAAAQNTPCSGKKGGISHCEGEIFVCKDGSASGSKRSCPAFLGAGTTRATPAPRAASGSCACASNTYCTGPRGGRYCVTSAGSKRYTGRR